MHLLAPSSQREVLISLVAKNYEYFEMPAPGLFLSERFADPRSNECDAIPSFTAQVESVRSCD